MIIDFVLAKTTSEDAKKSEDIAVLAVLDLVHGETIEKVMTKYSS